MDVNELVTTITREVIKQMTRKTQKECVMILENKNSALVAPVVDHLGEDVDLFFLDEEYGSRTPARYILPKLSCSRMVDLAAGRSSGPCGEEILRLVLAGIQVEIFEFEYRSYSDTAPGGLYRLYESYEKTLEGFGIREFIRKQSGKLRINNAVVTEKDILSAKNKGVLELRIPENANITSLAAECAQELNIKLLKS